MSYKIEMKNLDTIRPYENNAKLHNVDMISASIRDFKPDQPIVVDVHGVIIKGHGRYKAAISLGMTEFPVIVRDDLTPEEVRVSRIADNRSSEGGWDVDLLNIDIQRILDDMPDVNLDDYEIGIVDENKKIDREKKDKITPPHVCSHGDIWQMGGHSLMCGDSLQIQNIELMSKDAVLSEIDPPYEMSPGQQSIIGMKAPGCKIFWGMSFELYPVFKEMGICPQLDMVWRFYFGRMYSGNRPFCHHRNLWIYDIDFYNKDYRSETGQPPSTFFESAYKSEFHKHQKPLDIIEYLLNIFTKEGDLVFSPFGGSGSALIACENTGRICNMIEIEEKNCDVIIDRWQEFTGEKAIKK